MFAYKDVISKRYALSVPFNRQNLNNLILLSILLMAIPVSLLVISLPYWSPLSVYHTPRFYIIFSHCIPLTATQNHYTHLSTN
jgi:hypothetical protein